MGTDRVTIIEEEFISLGFRKIDGTIRQKAARLIAGEVDPGRIAGSEIDGEVKDLVNLYQEIKLAEFLRSGFDGLPAKDKLDWLRKVVEKPGSGFQSIDSGMALSGRGGFTVTALLKAYRDTDENIRDYARLRLEKILFTEKHYSITPGNVEPILAEMCRLEELPQPYTISEEKIKSTGTTITSFLFNLGGNIHVLSYQKNGGRMHTVIDTGDRRYRPGILKLFIDNKIEPGNIERILLTHHHSDHSGLLDVLCMVSGAKVLVHPDFNGDSIELDVSRFGKYLTWLPPASDHHVRDIGGIGFNILGEPVGIGEGAKLEILGLPAGDSVTHTVDQLLFLYTPKNSPATLAKIGAGFRPTDDILFSGDLWLMHPPGFFEETLRGLKVGEIMRARRRMVDFRPQNRREKDALKVGFGLITVKPGHGPEFLGTRILGTLLASRDIMVKLGFNENDRKDVLDDPEMVSRIRELKEKTYSSFIQEVLLWLSPVEKGGFGYKPQDIANFLLRIYKEQTGGGALVGQDRRERRVDLRQKLSRLTTDPEKPEGLRSVAGVAITMIEEIGD